MKKSGIIVLGLAFVLGVGKAWACGCQSSGGHSGQAVSQGDQASVSEAPSPFHEQGPHLAAPASDQVLGPGRYRARIKSVPCGGCASLIEKTMGENKGVKSAKVDMESQTLTFTVKKNVSLKLSDLQKELDAAAATMGMGADYGLYEIESLKKT
ncbi:MAG: cation transporter [Elusimicrobia bacterium]|nr:cation transporter [Elusimicrobiota bacterium]